MRGGISLFLRSMQHIFKRKTAGYPVCFCSNYSVVILYLWCLPGKHHCILMKVFYDTHSLTYVRDPTSLKTHLELCCCWGLFLGLCCCNLSLVPASGLKLVTEKIPCPILPKYTSVWKSCGFCNNRKI